MKPTPAHIKALRQMVEHHQEIGDYPGDMLQEMRDTLLCIETLVRDRDAQLRQVQATLASERGEYRRARAALAAREEVEHG